MASSNGSPERRRFGRRSSRVHGWIQLDSDSSAARIPCVMTNLSEGGARLTVDQARRLPPRFFIKFDGFGQPVSCAVREGDTGNLGVEFAGRRGAPQDETVRDLLTWLGTEGKDDEEEREARLWVGRQ